MERKCSQCRKYKCSSNFSNNQWRKGEGFSRCCDCVSGYFCEQCGREFNNPNELNMHMQVHRPRSVACPVCGEVRFASGANATQHVESGYCRGCPGRDNARQQIYDYTRNHRILQPYIVPRLTNGGYEDNDVPEFPYQCPTCNRCFRQMSQLLQHQDNKHGNSMRLRIAY